MQGDGSRRLARRAKLPRGGLLSGASGPMLCALCLMALGLTAAGCAAIGPTPAPLAPAGDLSIAFESIDGLPRDLSQKLARDLDEEASALRIAVVPAGGEAAYRLRGYLAAHAQGSTIAIAWAWDVYDAELHRAFRLSGEERARAGENAGRKPEGPNWAVADDAMLRTIARAGMQQLAGFMAAAPPPAVPQAPPPARNGSEVVATLPSAADGSDESLPVPLPPRRPALAGLAATRLADATSRP